MPDLKHLQADTTPEEIVRILREDGGLIIDNVLDAASLETLRSEVMPYVDNAKDGQNVFAGFKTRRIGALMARSRKCGELALNPLMNAACKDFLSPFCDGYQLHFSQVIAIGQGEGEQFLHKDRGVWGGHVPYNIETQFSTIWAMTDFTKENGATVVVPGSHLWDKDRYPKPEELAYAEMKAGSVLLYSGTTTHGGGANKTDERRIGVFLHYTLNWLRQEENQYLSCPPDIAKNLPKELRDLMGYTNGGPVLGFFSEPVGPGEGMELTSAENMFKD